MDAAAIAVHLADPAKATPKLVLELREWVRRTFDASPAPTPRQRALFSTPAGPRDSDVDAASRILSACARAIAALSVTAAAPASPEALAACRKRAAVVHDAYAVAAAALDAITLPGLLIEKRMVNVLTSLVGANLVPATAQLAALDHFKTRLERCHPDALARPSPNPWLLVAAPGVQPAPGLVQLVVAYYALRLRSLALRVQAEPFTAEEARALNADLLDTAQLGRGGPYWWLRELERTHGLEVARQQRATCAKLLIRLAPEGHVALWVVEWLAQSGEPLANVCAALAFLRPPTPLLATARLLERHPQFAQERLTVATLVVDWVCAKESAADSSTAPDDVLPWLLNQARALRQQQPESAAPCPVQLAIRIAVAHGALVAGNGSLTNAAVESMSRLLGYLRDYNRIEQADATGNARMRPTRSHIATLLRAGCNYVRATTRITDAFDPENVFDDAGAESLTVVHDSISLLVARLFPYLAVSRTVGRSLFEWLMYLAQLLVAQRSNANFSPDLALVHRNIATAYKVCRQAVDDAHLFSCLLRVSAVAHGLAQGLFDHFGQRRRQSSFGPGPLIGQFGSAPRSRPNSSSSNGGARNSYSAHDKDTSFAGAVQAWTKDRERALAGAIAIGQVAADALEAYLERQPPGAAHLVRAKLARRYEFIAAVSAAHDAYAGRTALGRPWRDAQTRAITVLLESRAWNDLATLISHNVRRHLAPSETSPTSHALTAPGGSGGGADAATSLTYTPLCSLVRSHWVFALEWRMLIAAGSADLAGQVFQHWERITPQSGIYRAHLLLAHVAQRNGVGCERDIATSIDLLLQPPAKDSPDELLRTELLALAYCYHAFAQDDATHLATAFELYERAVREKTLILRDDTRWHLRVLERILDGRSMHALLVQLHQIQLVIEHGVDRGNVLVRFARVYLALGYVGQAGKCITAASAYLPEDRRRGAWCATYAMYLIAIGNPVKAAEYLDRSAAAGDSHQGKVSATRAADPATAVLDRLARIQLYEAEGRGTDALVLALDTLPLAKRVLARTSGNSSLAFQVLAHATALFCAAGLWRDADSFAAQGAANARRQGNVAMQYRFATLQGTVAVYRRALDEVRGVLEQCPSESTVARAASSPTRRGLPRGDSAVHLDLELDARDGSPAADLAGLDIKENLSRLVVLGDAALLEAGLDLVGGSRPRPLPGQSGPVDEADEWVHAARSLLQRLKAPRHVADLFAADQRRYQSPRLQRFLHAGPAQQTVASSASSSSMSTPTRIVDGQLQLRELVPWEADLVRARAGLLFAQNNRRDAERIVTEALAVLNLGGPLYPRFVHDAAAVILAIVKPHLAKVAELALLNESAILLDATEIGTTRNPSVTLDTRLVTRLQMCRIHLQEAIGRAAGVAHPHELAEMAHMLLHVHTIDLAAGNAHPGQGAHGEAAAAAAWSVRTLLESACHGVTTRRMARILMSDAAEPRPPQRALPERTAHAVSLASHHNPTTPYRASTSSQSVSLDAGLSSSDTPAQSPAAAASFMAAMRETPVAQRRSQSGLPAATPSSARVIDQFLSDLSSRTTPRDQGPIEEDMLCLKLGLEDSDDSSSSGTAPRSSPKSGGTAAAPAIDPRVPSTWTVCQLAVDPAHNALYVSVTRGPYHAALRLALLRSATRGESAVGEETSYTAVLARLDAVVADSNTMLRAEYKSREAKYRWWEERRVLDGRLFRVLATIDECWLGCFRGMVGGAGAQVPRGAVRDFARDLAAFVEPARHPGTSAPLVVPVLVVEAWLALVLVPVVPNPLVPGSGKPTATSLTAADLEDMATFILEECARQGFGVATTDLAAAGDVEFDPLVAFLEAELRALRHRYGRTGAAAAGDHTVLILDAHLHAIPWESTAAMRGRSVSRVFSLEMLHGLLAAADRGGPAADRDSVFYVLNPSQDLPTTQATFEPILRDESMWHGTIGAPAPSATDFAASMAAHDVFLYIGHGGGEALCRPKKLVEHLLARDSLTRDGRGRAPIAAILMGCSSGKLTAPGTFDPIGTPVHYALAMLASRGGCVVANLWDVTDRDIDRYTVSMLRRWGLFYAGKQADEFGFGLTDAWHLPAVDLADAGEVPVPRSLVEADVNVPLPMAVAAARDDCQLPFLIGAAPVVYGIPVRLADQQLR
ncbi:separin protein [Blastocladiella emersonii ATCC 22665]|nr:separin protein [Blastocladiella emersonii ATCC 22665]